MKKNSEKWVRDYGGRLRKADPDAQARVESGGRRRAADFFAGTNYRLQKEKEEKTRDTSESEVNTVQKIALLRIR